MPYITPTELSELLPGDWLALHFKADRLLEAGTNRVVGYAPVADDHVLPFIAAACAEADSYIGVAYDLPLPATPPVLRQLVADITRYRIQADNPSPAVRQRYEDALALLARLAKGTASLGLPSAVEPVTSRARLGISRPAPVTKNWGL